MYDNRVEYTLRLLDTLKPPYQFFMDETGFPYSSDSDNDDSEIKQLGRQNGREIIHLNIAEIHEEDIGGQKK